MNVLTTDLEVVDCHRSVTDLFLLGLSFPSPEVGRSEGVRLTILPLLFSCYFFYLALTAGSRF